MTRSLAVTFDYRCPFAYNGNAAVIARAPRRRRLRVPLRAVLARPGPRGRGRAAGVGPRARRGAAASSRCCTASRCATPSPTSSSTRTSRCSRRATTRGSSSTTKTCCATPSTTAGLDADAVADEVASGRPLETLAAEHTEAVERWGVFGVPTFIEGDEAVFVRFMERGRVDDLERTLELLDWTRLNEFKRPRIDRLQVRCEGASAAARSSVEHVGDRLPHSATRGRARHGGGTSRAGRARRGAASARRRRARGAPAHAGAAVRRRAGRRAPRRRARGPALGARRHGRRVEAVGEGHERAGVVRVEQHLVRRPRRGGHGTCHFRTRRTPRRTLSSEDADAGRRTLLDDSGGTTMAHPAIDRIRGTAGVLTVVGVAPLLVAAPSGLRGGERPDTRPLPLDRGRGGRGAARRVRHHGRAGADARGVGGGRRAADPVPHACPERLVRAVPEQRARCSVPLGDRATICAAPDAPEGCTVPDVRVRRRRSAARRLPRAMRPHAARQVLRDSGLLPGEWGELCARTEPRRGPVPRRARDAVPLHPASSCRAAP